MGIKSLGDRGGWRILVPWLWMFVEFLICIVVALLSDIFSIRVNKASKLTQSNLCATSKILFP